MSESGERGAGRVWDLPVRICHWGLVAGVGGAFASRCLGSRAFRLHVLFGLGALGLALYRAGWSVLGTRHARFAEFVQRPGSGARPGRAPGHTVAGGWMALALLLLVLAQALSGLGANDEILEAGPLSGLAGRALSDALSRVHEFLPWVLGAAIGLHVAAALWYRIARGEDRIAALWSGRRRDLGGVEGIGPTPAARAWLLALAVAALLALVLGFAPAPLDLSD